MVDWSLLAHIIAGVFLGLWLFVSIIFAAVLREKLEKVVPKGSTVRVRVGYGFAFAAVSVFAPLLLMNHFAKIAEDLTLEDL